VDQQAKQPDGSANADPVKPADAAKPADSEKKPAEASVVPDKYEFKVPEGAQLNEALIAEATPLFKEMGLSQENAQKLFDFHNKAIADVASAPGKAYEDLRTSWRNDTVANKELGDGKALRPEVQANIAKAIDSLPNAKDFRAAMDLTGVGDNPAFVAAVNHWAKALAEGTLVRGGNPSPAGQAAPGAGPKSAAQAMYPGLPSSAG